MINKYKKQYSHPLWQKKRLEIMNRDKFTCQGCGDTDSRLSVHHKFYIPGNNIWDYENYFLVTLCDACHKESHVEINEMNNELSKMDYYLLKQFQSEISIAIKLFIDEN